MSHTKTLGASPDPSGGRLFLWYCPKKNPNTHSAAQIAAIAAVIEGDGW
jgi:hypothetical protein